MSEMKGASWKIVYLGIGTSVDASLYIRVGVSSSHQTLII
jgi:hypothetical protein